jgi:molecular chaperone DnaK (HSP70)
VEDTLLDVKDVASKSFGIVVMDAQKREVVFNIIKKNTTVPVDVAKTFPAGGDPQGKVQLRIMENSISEKTAPIESSTEIGTAILTLPAGLIKKPKIDVHFKLSKDGRLQISAEDTANSQTVDVEVRTSSVIQGEELESAIARSNDIIVE